MCFFISAIVAGISKAHREWDRVLSSGTCITLSLGSDFGWGTLSGRFLDL